MLKLLGASRRMCGGAVCALCSFTSSPRHLRPPLRSAWGSGGAGSWRLVRFVPAPQGRAPVGTHGVGKSHPRRVSRRWRSPVTLFAVGLRFPSRAGCVREGKSKSEHADPPVRRIHVSGVPQSARGRTLGRGVVKGMTLHVLSLPLNPRSLLQRQRQRPPENPPFREILWQRLLPQ